MHRTYGDGSGTAFGIGLTKEITMKLRPIDYVAAGAIAFGCAILIGVLFVAHLLF